MINDTTNTATGEPVTEQAPAVDTTSTTQATPATTPGLPDGYLSGGYYATTDKGDKYLRPEIAAALAPLRPSDFNALLREMKKAKKKTLPFEARQTAAAEMFPKALALVRRKKAPALLAELIQTNLNAIKNDADWSAYYRHLEAIGGYLSMPILNNNAMTEKGGD